MQAKDIMTEKVITFSPETGIVEAARVLMENHINGAPVLDGDGRLVGILCRDDLISQQKKLPLPSYFVVLDGIIPLISPKHIEKEVDKIAATIVAVPYTHLRAHETVLDLVCRLLLEKKNTHILATPYV